MKVKTRAYTPQEEVLEAIRLEAASTLIFNSVMNNKKDELDKTDQNIYRENVGLKDNISARHNWFAELKKSKINLKQKLLQGSLVLFFALPSLSSCKADEQLGYIDKLPFSVFPLNDVKWIYEGGSIGHELITDSNSVFVCELETHYSHIDTYFVKQISDNKAELYKARYITLRKIEIFSKDEQKITDSAWIEEQELVTYIYVENRKVYYGDETKKGYLLYDFTLNVGDTFMVARNFYYSGYPHIVSSIDSVKVWNEYRARYNFISLDEYEDTFEYIEGIGAVDKGFFYTLEGNRHADYSSGPELIGVYYKNKLIWTTLIYNEEVK